MDIAQRCEIMLRKHLIYLACMTTIVGFLINNGTLHGSTDTYWISTSTPNPINNTNCINQQAVISPVIADESLRDPRWSPDGKFLVVTGFESTYLFSVSDLSKILISYKPGAAQLSFHISGGITYLVYIDILPQQHWLHIISLDTFTEVYTIKREISSFLVSPNGKYLAIYNLTIDIVDFPSGKLKFKLGPEQLAYSFSQDSSLIATITVGETQNFISLWHTENGNNVKVINLFDKQPLSIAFSSIVNTLAIKYASDGIYIRDLETDKNRFILDAFYSDESRRIDLLFSTNGQTLAAIGPSKIYLWNVNNGNLLTWFDISNYDQYGGNFSPDGRLFLYWVYDYSLAKNILKIWDISTGQEVFTLMGLSNVDISPDGAKLAARLNRGISVFTLC